MESVKKYMKMKNNEKKLEKVKNKTKQKDIDNRHPHFLSFS